MGLALEVDLDLDLDLDDHGHVEESVVVNADYNKLAKVVNTDFVVTSFEILIIL
jgi:hypothetical protein